MLKGPFSGGKHAYTIRGQYKIPIPNPYLSDISGPNLKEILEIAEISKSEWESGDCS